MEGVTCPHCKETMYSAFWQVGKVKCIYCNKEFFQVSCGIEGAWQFSTTEESDEEKIRRSQEIHC